MHSSSPMVQPATKLLRETLANTHRSLGTRPRQDYTHCVMLNDCVSARWSPKYQCLALTSLRDSHRLPTRHIREPGTDQQAAFLLISIFLFSYFRFRTSVSISAFSTCPYKYSTNFFLKRLRLASKFTNLCGYNSHHSIASTCSHCSNFEPCASSSTMPHKNIIAHSMVTSVVMA